MKVQFMTLCCGIGYASLFTSITGWGAFTWQWWALCAPMCVLIGAFITIVHKFPRGQN
jgi:hypothetical protein